jgi:hypothetical protein
MPLVDEIVKTIEELANQMSEQQDFIQDILLEYKQ